MSQVMDPQVRQPGIPAQTIEDFGNRCVWLPGFDVDEQMVIVTFSLQIVQYSQRSFIQGNGTFISILSVSIKKGDPRAAL
jgi:hypothetical protein